MTMTKEKDRTADGLVPRPRRSGRRPAHHLEPSPYDLSKPMDLAPIRRRKDPRLPSQRLTAFWVVVKDQHVGRVVMVEFEDRPGWFYQPEVMGPADKRPVKIGEPEAKRRDAVNAVIDEWRTRVKLAGQ